MKVFMLGWEFPPFISGGLGTACYGLTKAMDKLGVEVTFCLPKSVETQYATHVELLSPESGTRTTHKVEGLKNVTFEMIGSQLKPYLTPQAYQKQIEETIFQKRKSHVPGTQFCSSTDYSGDMYSEVHRYADIAGRLAANNDFDIVHAHDWMTYPAAIVVSKISGAPLVVHVHSTEFDRSGENINQPIYDIERQGMHAADKVLAVSNYTKNIILDRYGVDEQKVEVVHNGVDLTGGNLDSGDSNVKAYDEKLVLFLGRITMQKGPEYFIHAAKKVLEQMDNVKFVMAGSGDMMHRSIELAADLGIGSKILFTGFLRGDDVKKIYRMADLFVMPSVSEPFGLVPLEALENDVPVIISKQSGVSEVLTHALKVDFWDIDEMANKIIAVLKYPPLKITLTNYGNCEVRKIRWTDSAKKCVSIYEQMLQAV
jgi:glycosyltransferase involved in cell wall biosynthesis